MRWLSALPLAFALSLLAPTASAQGDVDFSQIQDVARAKAEEGLARYGEEKWAEAYELFRVAEDLFHAPTLVLFMGHCQRELGQLLKARELYTRIANEELADDSPDAFRTAVETAAQQLQSLEARIPMLTVKVEGVPAESAKVQVNGEPVSSIPGTVALDPGKHRIIATAPDVSAIEQELELAEGARETVTLRFEKIVAPPPPLPTPQPGPIEPDPGSLVPAIVAGGVGIAGLALGGIAGGLSLRKVSQIKEECDGTTCPDRLQGDADEAQTLATLSNVGIIVGGVGAALAVTFVFWRPWGDDTPVEASAGSDGLWLRGRF